MFQHSPCSFGRKCVDTLGLCRVPSVEMCRSVGPIACVETVPILLAEIVPIRYRGAYVAILCAEDQRSEGYKSSS